MVIIILWYVLVLYPIANQTRKFVPGDVSAELPGGEDEYVMLKDATTVLEDIRKSRLV